MSFEHLFNELLDARRRYEDLRIAGGSFDERALLQSHLLELRAKLVASRNGVN
ncbi:MAG TPA: hypothetical protein VGC47_08570 [Acidimicrobiia bacterium]|jgi:hypothetical protein